MLEWMAAALCANTEVVMGPVLTIVLLDEVARRLRELSASVEYAGGAEIGRGLRCDLRTATASTRFAGRMTSKC
jgi:hypothetical protein